MPKGKYARPPFRPSVRPSVWAFVSLSVTWFFLAGWNADVERLISCIQTCFYYFLVICTPFCKPLCWFIRWFVHPSVTFSLLQFDLHFVPTPFFLSPSSTIWSTLCSNTILFISFYYNLIYTSFKPHFFSIFLLYVIWSTLRLHPLFFFLFLQTIWSTLCSDPLFITF